MLKKHSAEREDQVHQARLSHPQEKTRSQEDPHSDAQLRSELESVLRETRTAGPPWGWIHNHGQMKPWIQPGEGENDTECRELHESDAARRLPDESCKAGDHDRTETVADRGDRDGG